MQPFLERLAAEDRDRLKRVLSVRRYGHDEIVVTQHDVGADVFFVLAGCARATIFSRDGKMVAYRDDRDDRDATPVDPATIDLEIDPEPDLIDMDIDIEVDVEAADLGEIDPGDDVIELTDDLHIADAETAGELHDAVPEEPVGPAVTENPRELFEPAGTDLTTLGEPEDEKE